MGRLSQNELILADEKHHFYAIKVANFVFTPHFASLCAHVRPQRTRHDVCSPCKKCKQPHITFTILRRHGFRENCRVGTKWHRSPQHTYDYEPHIYCLSIAVITHKHEGSSALSKTMGVYHTVTTLPDSGRTCAHNEIHQTTGVSCHVMRKCMHM
jgi:hypothetical protein